VQHPPAAVEAVDDGAAKGCACVIC
jgi:hypothetical protein